MRIAVYGDVNLNYMDGSAVWAASVVQVLAAIPNAEVVFYLKAAVAKPAVAAPLYRCEHVKLVEPSTKNRRPLTPDEALGEIGRDHSEEPYDAILLRGFELSRLAAREARFQGILWIYLTDVPQDAALLTDQVISEIKQICGAARYLLCQTDQFKEFFNRSFPDARSKTEVLPPMVPDVVPSIPTGVSQLPDAPFNIIYAGKFAPLWASLEMLAIFGKIHARYPACALHVFGDKIHNPPEHPEFRQLVADGLTKTAGVIWHKAVEREEVLSAIPRMAIGWAWRHAALEEHTLELSTKVLEYSMHSVPCIMARNPVVESVFGSDYPFYANSEDEALAKLELALCEPAVLIEAASMVQRAALSFSFSVVRKRCLQPLADAIGKPAVRATVGVVGHDLKFVEILTEDLQRNFNFIKQYWWGHKHHDVYASEQLLEQADIIFCEWCLGNAVWFSENKRSGQKLLIRFHAQEIRADYPSRVDMEVVDGMIFVGGHVMEAAIEKFKWEKYRNKMHVIPNYVDVEYFDREKKSGSKFNLGIAGITPVIKRLDLALDILEELKIKDPRYQLFVKGKLPNEYKWMKRRDDENIYYKKQFDRIATSSTLKDSVHFDGWGSDMGEWYEKIGYILSMSDAESFHLSVAEGGASGAIPLVRNWMGARNIYPADWIVTETQEMIEKVVNFNDDDVQRETYVKEIKAYVTSRFDIKRISSDYKKLFDSLN